jgi:hypothetical protein
MDKFELFLLGNQPTVSLGTTKIWSIVPPSENETDTQTIQVASFESASTLKEIAQKANAEYFVLQVKAGLISIDEKELNIWYNQATNANAQLCYANYYELSAGGKKELPTIAYTEGSIRDDFNFGPLVLVKTSALKGYIETCPPEFQFAAWYSFRLFMSRNGNITKAENYVYSYEEPDLRASGAKQFDYVSPSNRARQIEMEQAATFHLKEIGALVSPPFKPAVFSESDFQVEASVIIPVRNRVKTLADAVNSVLNQKTNFNFNLIVIDNHSTDGTTELLKNIDDKRLVHIIPTRLDLGIGGCWNEGINHLGCGRFAVQLDSDDLYSDENTLQKVVDKFHSEQCAMVIGSYKMVNFNLEEIPPGVIDHREWTDNNGPNNALRINGLGAPRAFYTPVVRQIGFPNVSYGEDYAVAIAISGTYKLGRIYDPIYLCRRWDDNTDSNLSIDKVNAHNVFKDSLRDAEIKKRKKNNSGFTVE